MQDRPGALELLEAVQAHLAQGVAPVLDDPALRFRTLVAANVLGIVRRELELSGEQLVDEWQRLVTLLELDVDPPATTAEQIAGVREMRQRLCAAITSGAYDRPERWQALLDHCLRTAEEKLAISNPPFLARCQPELAP
jgi:hypothetical protein